MGTGGRTAGALFSLVLHGSLVLGLALAFPEPESLEVARAGLSAVRTVADTLARPLRAQAQRSRLVEDARVSRRGGTLQLGAFLLAANQIDAEEEGTPFDLESAAERYRVRVASLRKALQTEPIDRAVPVVFGDLRYAGLPGGRVGDLLLAGSGSCEPLSQLVASALYDAGVGDVARLRHYGGLDAGVSHLAPVATVGGVERDLSAGRPSARGGRAFAASELVEAYARAHDLGGDGASPVASTHLSSSASDGGHANGGGEETSALFGAIVKTRTMSSGYPPNDDRFEGSLPLYSDRAIAEAHDDDNASRGAKNGSRDPPPDGDADLARTCSFLLRVGELDPPRATALIGDRDEPIELTLHRVPSREGLERTAGLIAEVERARSRVESDPIQRVVALGCLVGLYDRASLEFSLSREADVARRAVLEAKKARAEGAAVIASLKLASDSGKGGRARLLEQSSLGSWVLLYLDGGADVVLRLAAEAGDDSFATVGFVAALIVDPLTRARGLALAASKPLDAQIAIMQELAHAQDNARPWSATYDPELSSEGQSEAVASFVATYGVLRPIAWRLWEAPVPPGEAIGAILEQAKRADLPEKTTRILVAYYVQNEIWFYGRRDDGQRILAELDAAVVAHGFPPLLEFDDIKPLPADATAIRSSLSTYAKRR